MPRSSPLYPLISGSDHPIKEPRLPDPSKTVKDPNASQINRFFRAPLIKTQENRPSPDFSAPRSVVTDGTYLYVSEFSVQPPSYGTSIIRKILPSGDGTVITVVSQADLVADLQTVNCIRDLAIDDTYLYASCWDSENIAIIDKARMIVVGWGWMGQGQRATSICTNGAKDFFCYGSNDPYPIAKFTTSLCLGQPPNTITPVLIYADGKGEWIRFGGRHIWYTDGGSGFGIRKIDPETMTLVASNPINSATSSLHAFDSIWMTEHNGTNLFRLDSSTLEVKSIITLVSSDYPSEIVVGPDNIGNLDTKLYVSNQNNPYVNIIDPVTNIVEAVMVVSPAAGIEGLATLGSLVYAMGFRIYYQTQGAVCYINYPTTMAGPVSYPKSLVATPEAAYEPRSIG